MITQGMPKSQMNAVKYRALAKDGTWRYGEYPHFAPEMSNTHYPMDVFWNNFLATFRRETLGQWTGLFDNHSKEIYEGDITRRHWDNGTFTDGEIMFEDAQFLWREINKEGFLHGKFIHPIGINTLHSEVIGNIYENPELLK